MPAPRYGRRELLSRTGGVLALAALPSRAGSDALDEALDVLDGRGPEYGGGLSNHGPMACEALCAMGRAGAAVPWARSYRDRLDADLRGSKPLARGDVEASFGRLERLGALTAFFRAELEESAPAQVLSRWVPPLLPGLSAVAAHGIIRAAHAARALSQRDSPARRHELAKGLGYWAARYRRLPEAPGTSAPSPPAEALARVPRLASERRPRGASITGRLRALDGDAAFAPAIHLLDDGGEPARVLSSVTELFARVLLSHAQRFATAIAFLHGVTGPSAVRLLLPYLTPDQQRHAVRRAWQFGAALQATAAERDPAPAAQAAPAAEALIDEAVDSGDEHAFKIAEACLREHAVHPRPVYLAAARAAIRALR